MGYHWAMPTKKYEWNEYDRCAAESISHLMKAHGFSDRGMASALENVISYNRVRDLRMALKAPVRLSEFLAICDVCHADPVATLREIIAEAQRIQAEQEAREREEDAREARRRELDEVAAEEERKRDLVLAKLRQGDTTLAAYEDPHKLDPDIDDAA